MGAFDDIMNGTAPELQTAPRGPFDDIMGGPAPKPAPVEAPLGPDKSTWTEYARDVAAKAAQGVTMRYGDEIAALMGSGFGLGKRVGLKDRQEILDDIHKKEDAFTKRNPKTAVGAEIAGALAPSLVGGSWVLRAPGMLARAGRSAAAAAPMGALTATGELRGDKTFGDYAEAAGEGAATSAALGAGLSAAGSTVGRVVGPWASAAAQRLSDRGVRLTPGELVGGYAKRMEDSLGSVPVVGRMVRARQAEGNQDFNRTILNETLGELNQGIGPRLTTPNAQLPDDMPMGRAAIHRARMTVSDAYNRIVPRLRAHIDVPMQNEIRRLTYSLPEAVRNDFADAVTRRLLNSADALGNMGGRDVQNALQGLEREARHHITSPASTAHHVDLGYALRDMYDHLMTNVERNVTPQVRLKFQNVNRAFARLVRAQKAAGSVAANEGDVPGVFNASQYHNAVKTSDRSARRADFASGHSLGQDISDDAKVVMTRKVNDSGTPERSMLAGMLGGAGILATGHPGALAAPAALVGLYTHLGNRMFQRSATYAPRVRMLLRNIIEGTTSGGAPAFAEIMRHGYGDNDQ
jgi:hypothetical protein